MGHPSRTLMTESPTEVGEHMASRLNTNACWLL